MAITLPLVLLALLTGIGLAALSTVSLLPKTMIWRAAPLTGVLVLAGLGGALYNMGLTPNLIVPAILAIVSAIIFAAYQKKSIPTLSRKEFEILLYCSAITIFASFPINSTGLENSIALFSADQTTYALTTETLFASSNLEARLPEKSPLFLFSQIFAQERVWVGFIIAPLYQFFDVSAYAAVTATNLLAPALLFLAIVVTLSILGLDSLWAIRLAALYCLLHGFIAFIGYHSFTGKIIGIPAAVMLLVLACRAVKYQVTFREAIIFGLSVAAIYGIYLEVYSIIFLSLLACLVLALKHNPFSRLAIAGALGILVAASTVPDVTRSLPGLMDNRLSSAHGPHQFWDQVSISDTFLGTVGMNHNIPAFHPGLGYRTATGQLTLRDMGLECRPAFLFPNCADIVAYRAFASEFIWSMKKIAAVILIVAATIGFYTLIRNRDREFAISTSVLLLLPIISVLIWLPLTGSKGANNAVQFAMPFTMTFLIAGVTAYWKDSPRKSGKNIAIINKGLHIATIVAAFTLLIIISVARHEGVSQLENRNLEKLYYQSKEEFRKLIRSIDTKTGMKTPILVVKDHGWPVDRSWDPLAYRLYVWFSRREIQFTDQGFLFRRSVLPKNISIVERDTIVISGPSDLLKDRGDVLHAGPAFQATFLQSGQAYGADATRGN